MLEWLTKLLSERFIVNVVMVDLCGNRRGQTEGQWTLDERTLGQMDIWVNEYIICY